MSIKKIVFFVLFFILAFCVLLTAKATTFTSHWLPGPIKIDGNDKDWAAAVFNTEKSVQVDYTFINNNESLYVLFVFKDKKFLSTLTKTGITLWFNNQGKKKKELGVHFQTRLISAASMIVIMEKKNGPLTEDRKNEIRSKPSYYLNQCLLVDKDSKLQTGQFPNDAALPEFAVLGGSGRLVFEFRIPIAADNVLGVALGKSTMVGFEWGGSANKELKGEGDGESISQESINEYQEYDEEGGAIANPNFPSWNRPKRYSFWCELLVAAGQ